MPIKLVSEDAIGNAFRQHEISPKRVLTPLGGVHFTGKQLATGPALAMYVGSGDDPAAQAEATRIETALGRPLDAIVAFTDVDDITENTFPFTLQWPGDRKLILSQVLAEEGWDMDEAADGTHDALYQEAVDNLIPYRNRIFSLRIGWEMNADPGGFPWSIGGPGTNQSAANYVAAFARFAEMVRLAMPEVLIEWCPLWDQPDPATWYPGDAYVDIIGSDVYLKEAFWTDQFYDTLANAPFDLQVQEAMAQSRGKFLAISEWGTDFNTGTWVTSMLKWMERPRSARLLYHGYWNSDASFDSSFATYPVNEAAFLAHCNELTDSKPR